MTVRLMGKMVLCGSRSATCNSVNFLCHKYNLNKYNDFLDVTCTKIDQFGVINPNHAVLAGAIRDFCHLKYHHMFISRCDTTVSELSDIIEYMCTT